MKLASPRWAKEFMKLSPKSQQYLLSILRKEREIKHLGMGGERVADLVVNPRFGLSVRKVPKLEVTKREEVKKVLRNRRRQRDAEYELRRISRGKGPFSFIKGHEGERAYYDFAPGKPGDYAQGKAWDALERQKASIDAATKPTKARFEGVLKRKPKATEGPEREAWLKEYRAVRKELDSYRGRIKELEKEQESIDNAIYARQPLSDWGEAVVEELKKSYPHLRDIRGANVVGGKVVDFTPGGEEIVTYHRGSLVPRGEMLAHSKKKFLRRGPSSRQGFNPLTGKRWSKSEQIAADKLRSTSAGKAARRARRAKLRKQRLEKKPVMRSFKAAPIPKKKPVARLQGTSLTAPSKAPPKTSKPSEKKGLTDKQRAAIAVLGSAGLIGSSYGVYKYISRRKGADGKYKYKYDRSKK